ncbi:MAG TPA: radical SAM protein, partial [Candidatus Aminicenantes bacterium]|nr:radical SAM protein [Candidatus Aminicenantes bacterium]
YINRPAGDQLARQQELKTEEWKEFLQEAASLGCLTVRFTGGEPLLREDFEEIYQFTRRLGMRVSLSTNASLITSPLAALFKKIPPLEEIEITIYGLSERTYEEVTRVVGSYQAMQAGLAYLRENKIRFSLRGIVLPATLPELDRFKKWAQEMDASGAPPALVFSLDLRARRDSEQRNQEIARLRLPPEKYVQLIAQERELYNQTMKEFVHRFLGPRGTKLFTCGAGQGIAALDSYGQLQPCLLLRHPRLVYPWRQERNLKKAMMDFFPSLREMEAENDEYLKKCARCFISGLCEQCPARSWMESGTLDTPIDYYCQVAHAQARQLGLLSPGEKGWQVKDWSRRLKKVENLLTSGVK